MLHSLIIAPVAPSERIYWVCPVHITSGSFIPDTGIGCQDVRQMAMQQGLIDSHQSSYLRVSPFLRLGHGFSVLTLRMDTSKSGFEAAPETCEDFTCPLNHTDDGKD